MSVEDEVKALEAVLKKFGFSDGTPDQMCLQLNPPSSKVKVLVRAEGSSREPQVLRPNKTGIVDLSILQNSRYEINIVAMKVKPMKVLQKFTLAKSDDGLDIRGVDTGGTLIESIFTNKDNPCSDNVVLGTYTDKSGVTHKLKGRTNMQGIFKIVLPPGEITDMTAQSKDGQVVVPLRGTITIPEILPSESGVLRKKPRSIRIELDPSSFASAVETDGSKVVILGDISGSMHGPSMDILRKSFMNIADNCFQENQPFALAAWDSWVDWFSTSWISPAQKSELNSFISRLNARGGNDMRYAIEQAIQVFPDVEQIYVMCDGDISPFSLAENDSISLSPVPKPASSSCESYHTSYRGTPWKRFRERYNTITFHFIALGKGSHANEMEKMATIGGGRFWQSS